MRYPHILISVLFASCGLQRNMKWQTDSNGMTGSDFYKQAAAMKWSARDSFVLSLVEKHDIPDFLSKFHEIKVNMVVEGRTIHASYWVAPDYFSIGNDKDWARVNITPMAAQKIADQLQCFLPTKKMVDDIYKAAIIKLEPVPMYAFRDSTPTMWQHHLIIEGQRKERRGLIAGIKKDIVITGKLLHHKPDRVAIYGWHQLNGKPIQPLYTGHINWWVDYSQGVRLIWRKIKIGQRWMDYKDVLRDPVLRNILCDEPDCGFFNYEYK